MFLHGMEQSKPELSFSPNDLKYSRKKAVEIPTAFFPSYDPSKKRHPAKWPGTSFLQNLRMNNYLNRGNIAIYKNLESIVYLFQRECVRDNQIGINPAGSKMCIRDRLRQVWSYILFDLCPDSGIPSCHHRRPGAAGTAGIV